MQCFKIKYLGTPKKKNLIKGKCETMGQKILAYCSKTPIPLLRKFIMNIKFSNNVKLDVVPFIITSGFGTPIIG